MKRWKIAALCAVCVMGTLLQGCSIYDKADLDKMSATPGDAFRANADSDLLHAGCIIDCPKQKSAVLGRIRKT